MDLFTVTRTISILKYHSCHFQTSEDGDILMAVYDNHNLTIWNMETFDALNSFNLQRLVIPPNGNCSYHANLDPKGNFLVITVDAQHPMWEHLNDRQKQQSIAIIKISTKKGRFDVRSVPVHVYC